MIRSFLFPLVAVVFTLAHLASADDKSVKKVTLKDDVVTAHVKVMKQMAEERKKPKPSKTTLVKLQEASQESSNALVETIAKQLEVGNPTYSFSTSESFKSFYSKLDKDDIHVTEVLVNLDLDKEGKPNSKEHPYELKKMVFKTETFQKVVEFNKKAEPDLQKAAEKFGKALLNAGEDKEKIVAAQKELGADVAEVMKPAKPLMDKLEGEVRKQLGAYGVTKDSKVFQEATGDDDEAEQDDLTLFYVTPGAKQEEVEVVKFVLNIATDKGGDVSGLMVQVIKQTQTRKVAPKKD